MADAAEEWGAPLRSRDPRQLGPWHLRRRLGSGSMGVVFLATREDGTHGAVKVIAEHIEDEKAFRARFAREVKVLRRVGGPYVADVLDSDAWAETPYLVTEVVHGPALDRVVEDGGPLPADGWDELAHGLLVALVRVHAAGVVHRDIKPENIIMTGRRPCLIDFGLAVTVDGTSLTGTATLLGTIGWMAPERIRGEVATPASDIFALGAVLTFAGTGRPPFDATDPLSAVMRVLTGEVDLTGLSAAQADLVRPMLAQDPAARPTAEQSLRAWEQLSGRRAGG